MFSDELMAVAKRYVAMCNSDEERQVLEELYADDAQSVEALAMGENGAVADGKAAIQAKQDWWWGAHEVHSSKVTGPFFHGEDQFGVIFEADITTKETGERTTMKELGVLTVKDGKIVREAYYYED